MSINHPSKPWQNYHRENAVIHKSEAEFHDRAGRTGPTPGNPSGWAAWRLKHLWGVGHGMQMGPSGFGMTHGDADEDEGSMDVSHEFKGSPK